MNNIPANIIHLKGYEVLDFMRQKNEYRDRVSSKVKIKHYPNHNRREQ